MRALRDFVTPWAMAGLVLWLLVMIVVTQLAIPAFANVASGPAVFCPHTTCPPQTTTEWLPSLATAFLAATLVVGTIWGVVTVSRRRL